jgi:hypothetical protein
MDTAIVNPCFPHPPSSLTSIAGGSRWSFLILELPLILLRSLEAAELIVRSSGINTAGFLDYFRFNYSG